MFEMSEEQQLVLETVRRFAREEVAPRAARVDREHLFPRENLEGARRLGLMGMPIPERWGGAGYDFLSYMLAVEEIAKACASTAVILAVHTSMACFSVLNFGTPAQKEKYLTQLAGGSLLGAFAITEPEAGSDAGALSMRAVRKGDRYIVNGTKIFITSAGAADLYVTFVSTDPSRGARGITALLVEKDTPGFRVGRLEEKMGLHGSPTGELIFENAEVPVENILGEENKGFSLAMSLLEGGRIGIGAQAVGIATAALETAVAYARQRVQFRQNIASFQGIQFMLADMATAVDAARLLVYRAASLKDRGQPHGKEASMAKLFATDTAMQVTTNAVQVLGGYGYCREYPVERYMRDAKVTQIYEGTSQIQRLVIARHLTK
ncbi:MAG: acyl-CoA dehydrogenase [Peptococcaceae bacterium]|jgi:butyryl-CoA dehydrogenase|nr:acyl-CoA dehydrogenase [Peptococcaceae bacterium]